MSLGPMLFLDSCSQVSGSTVSRLSDFSGQHFFAMRAALPCHWSCSDHSIERSSSSLDSLKFVRFVLILLR
jgi:hypothetical protein